MDQRSTPALPPGPASSGVPFMPQGARVAAMLLLFALPVIAEEAAYWPQFHGPRRDNISTETGFLKSWPEAGPPLLWTYRQCGNGYSGVAIVQKRIFSAGDFGKEERVFALNMEGELLWSAPNGESWRGSTPGARTTPTYDEGWLYHMNPFGRISAFEAQTGQLQWTVDLKERFAARYGTWAMAENLIVDGQSVFCLPGGSGGFAVSLNKRTGETQWVNKDVDERAAYCSPILASYKGVRHFITLAQTSIVALNADSGELLWSHPFGKVWQNTTSPIFQDGRVFATCGHSSGGTVLKIADDLRGTEQVWYRERFDNCHGGVLLIDGNLYGCGCRLGGKAFFCVDFLTGEIRYETNALGKVSITYADGMLYCLDDQRKVTLAALSPDEMKIVSQFSLPEGSKDLSLCHPVVCGGRLYLRHDQTLYVYGISSSSRESR